MEKITKLSFANFYSEIKIEIISKNLNFLEMTEKDYDEFTIAVIGNVDSGKSTTVGVLTTNILDDGNGLARKSVMVHNHEKESGRTSDISYRFLKNEEKKRIYTFVDLAGHEKYLKTTISGISSSFPDLAIVCVNDKITKMTKEHINIVYSLEIPILLIFTKIDADRNTLLLVDSIRKLFGKNKSLFQIKSKEDCKFAFINPKKVPYVFTSNTTGAGIDVLLEILNVLPKKISKDEQPETFMIDHVFRGVKGFSMIVSGFSNIEIKSGEKLYLGPVENENTVVSVKTLHNDYRNPIAFLKSGIRGCVSLGMDDKFKNFVKRGMILSKVPQQFYSTFEARVKIFHHHSHIVKGFQAVVNIRSITECVIFENIECETDGKIINAVRSGQFANITMKFLRGKHAVNLGDNFLFREGSIRGIGKITGLVE